MEISIAEKSKSIFRSIGLALSLLLVASISFASGPQHASNKTLADAKGCSNQGMPCSLPRGGAADKAFQATSSKDLDHIERSTMGSMRTTKTTPRSDAASHNSAAVEHSAPPINFSYHTPQAKGQAKAGSGSARMR